MPSGGGAPKFDWVKSVPQALALGRDPNAPDWCLVCFTRHSPTARCAGDLPATGAERHGWKVVVETPHAMEAFGVLVAPVGDLWRARILTYPRALWTVPGGHGIMKFIARTPQLAEQQAIRFIEEFCAQRGYTMRHGLELAVLAQMRGATAKAAPEPVGPILTSVTPRFPVVLPLLYGVDAPTLRAVTRNLSQGGLFVQTPAPISDGSALTIQLSMPAARLPLRGTVVWSRGRVQPGRPPGMGVRLVKPPHAFLEYLRSLPPPSDGF